jgi:hypothetical protein
MLPEASKEHRRAHSGPCDGGYSGGSVQRYIEEVRDIEEPPVYLPGDRIGLRLQAVHEVNLGGIWAVFRRLPERGETSDGPYLTLPGEHRPLSRAGPVRTSGVYFEVQISRDQHLPGDYELEAVRAYPYEPDGREDLILEFEVRGKIRFRIAEELDIPSPRVTAWKFD